MEQALGVDLLPYVMSVVPPSRVQIAHLRDLRRVSREFKRAVDFILVDKNWLRPLREHVNTPPTHLNRFEYMREYNFDRATQEFIITRLMQELAIPENDALVPAMVLARQNVRNTRMHSLVGWAMRVHPNSRIIQLDGCRVLSHVSHTTGSFDGDFLVHTVASLAAVMHDNLADVELQLVCLTTLRCVLDEAFAEDLPAVYLHEIIQTEAHNLPNLIIGVMREHPANYDLHKCAARLLCWFGTVIRDLRSKSCMRTFVMHEAENVLLASIHRHLLHVDPATLPTISHFVMNDAQSYCILALKHLLEFDIAGMQRIEESMQCAINITVQDKHDFVESMYDMFDIIMEELETFPIRKTQMQNYAASSGIVQIYLQKIAPAEDAEVNMAYTMVTKICEGNTATTVLMAEADVVGSIDSVAANSEIRGCVLERDKLIAILASHTARRTLSV